MTQTFIIKQEPMGKPRQTRSDKWNKRKCVVRYRAYADKLRAACKGIMAAPAYVGWVAYLTMPASWSAKKKAAHAGKIHRSKPDRDNVDKGILDALIQDDQCVSAGSTLKLWDDGGGARIILTVSDDQSLPDWVVSELLAQAVPRNPAA